jgi:hypothetical protein
VKPEENAKREKNMKTIKRENNPCTFPTGKRENNPCTFPTRDKEKTQA